MKNKPEYAENIIVGVNFNSEFNWYVTDKELWILDQVKWINDYNENGINYEVLDDFLERFDMPIVSEENANIFLKYIEDYKTNYGELMVLVKNKDVEETILELSPSLFVDFDKKRLYSCYPEPLRFEKYISKGWVGKIEDFTRYIPRSMVYWIIDGVDVIKQVYNKEVEKF
ncbi:hypothetical protein [Clostridium sp.]|uniref:hypothetical protein n=1 Tax=Clostridium sp. TaxID=1506 RepID=UPI002611AAB2|nr:hypothetical protein [uncultured Clostridium sp.]